MRRLLLRTWLALTICLLTGISEAMAASPQNVTVNTDKCTLQQLFKMIEQQTTYHFSYDDAAIDNRADLSIKMKAAPVTKVLDAAFKNRDLAYNILSNNTIVVAPKKSANGAKPTGKSVKVTGQVVDENGDPVLGATVRVKGSDALTVTDMDGNFNMDVPQGADLLVTYIGYSPAQVKAVADAPLAITMKEDNNLLDEVVVVGYGTQKKVNLTGAVAQIDDKAFESRPVQNVAQAIQGLVPGLTMGIGADGGQLNNSPSVAIRGAGTISTGSTASPLVLIDGVAGDMNSVNPQDIENISVLKDASSSSIYGSRAPFGVILITTKKGQVGKTKINYYNNVRFATPTTHFHSMNSYKFMNFVNDARTNGGQQPYFTDEQMANTLAYLNGEVGPIIPVSASNAFTNNWGNVNTDWYDVFMKDHATSWEQSLNLSGGTEKYTYFLSGNFMDQNGLIKYTDETYKRYALNGKIHVQVNKYVAVNYNMKWTRTDYDAPSALTEMFWHQLMRKWPNSPLLDPNGYYADNSRVIEFVDGGRQKETVDRTYNQLQINITPLKGWNIHLDGAYRYNTTFAHTDYQKIYAHDADGNPYPIQMEGFVSAGQSRVEESAAKTDYYSVNLYTDYTRQFGAHYLRGLLGFNAEHNNYRNLRGQREDIIVGELPTLDTSASLDKTSGGYTHWATAGFFGRINYNYKERYLLELNARYDGTSRFKRDKRWNLFPSVSAGWNIARESFWEPYVPYVNTLKLRASWGELGNQNTSSLYPFYSIQPVSINNGNWLVGGNKTNTANIPALVSALLTWEKVRSTNFGFDFGALNNRLTGSFDYFVRKTVDMVGPAPQLPAILGIAVPKVNNADMKSYGFELEIGWRDRVGSVNYGVKFNLGDARQKVTRYPNTTNAIGDWYAGKMNGEIWGYTTIGIAKTQEEMNEHLASLPNGGQNTLGNKWGAGDVMYADLNGDGVVNGGKGTLSDPGDRTIIGNTTPRYNYGLVLDGSWKGFDLSIFLQGVGKRDFAPQAGTNSAVFWGAVNNIWQSIALADHWDYFRPEGHEMGANLNAYYPRPDFTSNKNHQVQTRYLQDASYLRLKNVQLGYTLPRSLTMKIGVNRCRVYFSGDNLLTFTKLADMFDPEVLAAGSWGSGKSYPISKVVSFGINLGF